MNGRKVPILFGLFLAAAVFLPACSRSGQEFPAEAASSENFEKGSVPRMTEPVQITIDFSKRGGVPLLKKFGLFNSGMVSLEQYERDAYLLDDLRTDSLRIDLFMGNEGQPFARVVDGTKEEMTYHFEELDGLVRLLEEHGVRPYWSWSYIPIPLQQDGDWRKGPVNLEQWQNMFRELAAHYRENGMRIAYHEVYNEPDCGDVFFLGTMEDYTELYVRAAKGMKEGDPGAVVGGPSSAFIAATGGAEMSAFLDRVLEEDVPLDFFSYHSYGCDKNQYISRTRQARELLSQHVEFDTTELHLNEYNSLIQPFLPDGPAEHSIGGATMLTSFERLLEETDVTLAHWAQFLDTGYEPLGMVDPQGRIKAPYQAYWMYSQMPEERVAVEGLSDSLEAGVHAMASSDADSACILIWNDGQESRDVQITWKNLPCKSGTCEIYTVNDENDPYWNTDGKIEIEPRTVLTVEEMEDGLTLDLPAGGFTLYRILPDNREEGSADKTETVGTMIRKRYYFPERGKSSYSFYDETDQTAYLGMNGEYSARAVVAQELEDLPDIVGLDCQFGGNYEEIDLNTSFSVRVDYEVDGEYTKAVLYTFMPINERRDGRVPWGTKREADEVILSETLLTGNTWLMLRENAPEGWEGHAILTYDMHSTGSDTWAELRLSQAGQ